MSQKGSNKKRERTPRKSQGLVGASKHPLNAVQKVLLGKGLMQSVREVPMLSPWRGVTNPRSVFDARQVAENRRLYPNLFREGRR